MIKNIPWWTLGRWILAATPIVLPVYVVAMSLEEASWPLRSSQLEASLFLGLVFGFLFAKSKFRGRTVLIYSLIFSIFFSSQLVIRLFPFREILQLNRDFELIWMMHVRLLTFLVRVTSWIRAYSLGDPIRDLKIHQFELAFLLFNTTIWFAWWTIRKRRVLVGAVPLGFILALNIHRFDLSLIYLQLYILCNLLTLVIIHFNMLIGSWIHRRVDHPAELSLDWGISAVSISVAVLLLASPASLVATPEGWDTILDWLRTEEPVPRVSLSTDSDSFDSLESLQDSQTPQLIEIGAPPSTGSNTMMWVEISDPPPLPDSMSSIGSTPQHYWRSRIYTSYNGRGWEPLEDLAIRSEAEVDLEPPPGRYALTQTFNVAISDLDFLFAVNQPRSITSGRTTESILQEGVIRAELAGDSEYTVTSWATSAGSSELISSKGKVPQEILKTYLQLPSGIPARVTDLANDLTLDLPTPYEKAVRIESYLRTYYSYTLDVAPPPENQDVVDYFLFDAEGGFCSYYATTMVVMLRSIGIPARVVSGFAMGSFDYEQSAYRVLERDSHAWVEAYLPEIGWIEFEPTSNRVPFHGFEEDLQDAIGEVDSGGIGPSLRRFLLPIILSIALFGSAILALGIWLNIIRIRVVADKRYGRPGEIYALMRQILSGAGFQEHASVTPNEFLKHIGVQIPNQVVIIETLRSATEGYSKIRYGGIRRYLEDDDSLDQLWREHRGIWYRFAIQRRVLALSEALHLGFFRIKTKEP